jgi:hypothetical protein
MADLTMPTAQSDPIALEPLPPPRRSIEGHYGIAEHVQGVHDAQVTDQPDISSAQDLPGLNGDVVIDIGNNGRSPQTSFVIEQIEGPANPGTSP